MADFFLGEENIVGKGEKIDMSPIGQFFYDRIEISCPIKCWLPAFSSFPTMFSKAIFRQVRPKLRLYGKELTLYYAIPSFNDPKKEAFENIMGKGENAGNEHFFPFPTMFSIRPKTEIIISATFNLSSAYALNLVQSEKKNCR